MIPKQELPITSNSVFSKFPSQRRPVNYGRSCLGMGTNLWSEFPLRLHCSIFLSPRCPSFCLYELDFSLTFSVICDPVPATPTYPPASEAALAFDISLWICYFRHLNVSSSPQFPICKMYRIVLEQHLLKWLVIMHKECVCAQCYQWAWIMRVHF